MKISFGTLSLAIFLIMKRKVRVTLDNNLSFSPYWLFLRISVLNKSLAWKTEISSFLGDFLLISINLPLKNSQAHYIFAHSIAPLISSCNSERFRTCFKISSQPIPSVPECFLSSSFYYTFFSAPTLQTPSIIPLLTSSFVQPASYTTFP